MERCTIETPIGPLHAMVEEGALVELKFGTAGTGSGRIEIRPDPVTAQLREYFSGSRREFDVKLSPRGTEFQRAVWNELLRVPYGTTISYGELARRIGRPDAVRAVGAANGANPIPIIVPCHRVIGANGTLTGYGGGLDRKRWLLDLEQRGRKLF
jgi:methylated-DNA-[protein]-cysteine S-methyltransferase